MQRRQLLKMISLAGMGSLMAGTAWWQRTEAHPTYFLITDQPDADRAHLVRLARRTGMASINVSTSAIQPAGQDLSLLHQGRLLDPLRAEPVAQPLVDFTRVLRTRPRHGHTLLTIAPTLSPSDDAVTFEHNGVVIDRIPLHKKYKYIDMPGEAGSTVFRLDHGKLWVVGSSCHHEVCKKMGVRTTGRLICAPNRLVATLPYASRLVDTITG